MPYIASNNGLTVIWHDPAEDYQPKPFEVAFAHYPQAADLTPVFPSYAATVALPPPSAVIEFRDKRLGDGFTDTAPGLPTTGLVFACDLASRAAIAAVGSLALAAIQQATQPPPSFPFIAGAASSVAGQTVSMTPPQALAWSERIATWVTSTYLYGNAMIQAILAGNPPADFTAGWP